MSLLLTGLLVLRGQFPPEERYMICFPRQTGGGWYTSISRVVRPAATLAGA